MSRIIEKSDHIKIDGHIGRWHVIESKVYSEKTLFLLEHDFYGDEAASLIVDGSGNIVLDEVWNGFLDYEESL